MNTSGAIRETKKEGDEKRGVAKSWYVIEAQQRGSPNSFEGDVKTNEMAITSPHRPLV